MTRFIYDPRTPYFPRKVTTPDYCGCCGREYTNGDSHFCLDCIGHVSNTRHAPWDRTYYAIHGSECPFARSRT